MPTIGSNRNSEMQSPLLQKTSMILRGVHTAAFSGVENANDVTKLSRFPIPGDPRRASQFPQYVWTGSDDETKETTREVENLPLETLKTLNNKLYWMPDKICKVCYECGTPFTMFRRRHHCRVCGQVFCQNCSGNNIDGRDFGSTGFVRSCKRCYEQHRILRRETAQTAPRRHFTRKHMASIQSKSSRMKGSMSTSRIEMNVQSPSSSYAVGESWSDDGAVGNEKAGRKTLRSRRYGGRARTKTDFLLPSSPRYTRSHSLSRIGDADSVFSTSQDFQSQHQLMQRAISGDGRTGSSEPFPLSVGNFDMVLEIGGGEPVDVEALRIEFESSQELPEAAARFSGEMEEAAVRHLETMVRQLLKLNSDEIPPNRQQGWAPIITCLVQQLVATVDPDVKHGDHLDVRPYTKIKLIAGGSMAECRYVDGVVFRKNVAHKDMARVIERPRILLVSGGIEFQPLNTPPTSTGIGRLNSLETILEQEEQHTRNQVDRIAALKPNLVLVQGAVSRSAQDLLREQGIVLIQNVKTSLMERIARMIGTIIPPAIESITSINAAESQVGSCGRYSALNFRSAVLEQSISSRRESLKFSADATQDYWKKPTEFAMRLNVPDGDAGGGSRGGVLSKAEASVESSVRRLVGKVKDNVDEGNVFSERWIPREFRRIRGRGQTTCIFLEGCPKSLGCTIVLRGGEKPELRAVKSVVNFAIAVAYNLRLEVAYLNDRRARLPAHIRAEKEEEGTMPLLSSSLMVDFGAPDESLTDNEKALSPLLHQNIFITSIWMAPRTQCYPAEVKRRRYYDSKEDMTLGQFLLDCCFNPNLKCQNAHCKRSVYDHVLHYVHGTGSLSISIGKLPKILPFDEGVGKEEHAKAMGAIESEGYSSKPNASSRTAQNYDRPIFMWSHCRKCARMVTPMVRMSEDTWRFSFGKFLEVFYYNNAAVGRSAGCSHVVQQDHILFFGCGNLVARFEYKHIQPYCVLVNDRLDMGLKSRALPTSVVSSALAGLAIDTATLFSEFKGMCNQFEILASEPSFKGIEAREVIIKEGRSVWAEVRAMAEGLLQNVAGHSAAVRSLGVARNASNHFRHDLGIDITMESDGEILLQAYQRRQSLDPGILNCDFQELEMMAANAQPCYGPEEEYIALYNRIAANEDSEDTPVEGGHDFIKFLLRFRRAVYWRATHWNDRLTATGKLLQVVERTAKHRKRSESSRAREDELNIKKAIRRLEQIKKAGPGGQNALNAGSVHDDFEVQETEITVTVADLMVAILDRLENESTVESIVSEIISDVIAFHCDPPKYGHRSSFVEFNDFSNTMYASVVVALGFHWATEGEAPDSAKATHLSETEIIPIPSPKRQSARNLAPLLLQAPSWEAEKYMSSYRDFEASSKQSLSLSKDVILSSPNQGLDNEILLAAFALQEQRDKELSDHENEGEKSEDGNETLNDTHHASSIGVVYSKKALRATVNRELWRMRCSQSPPIPAMYPEVVELLGYLWLASERINCPSGSTNRITVLPPKDVGRPPRRPRGNDNRSPVPSPRSSSKMLYKAPEDIYGTSSAHSPLRISSESPFRMLSNRSRHVSGDDSDNPVGTLRWNSGWLLESPMGLRTGSIKGRVSPTPSRRSSINSEAAGSMWFSKSPPSTPLIAHHNRAETPSQDRASTSYTTSIAKSREKNKPGANRLNFPAFARFLRGVAWGDDDEEWSVDVSAFEQGRPRLGTGRTGDFIPIFENQPTTIIAHSLASKEYKLQLMQYTSQSNIAEASTDTDGELFTSSRTSALMSEMDSMTPRLGRSKFVGAESLKNNFDFPMDPPPTPLYALQEGEEGAVIPVEARVIPAAAQTLTPKKKGSLAEPKDVQENEIWWIMQDGISMEEDEESEDQEQGTGFIGTIGGGGVKKDVEEACRRPLSNVPVMCELEAQLRSQAKSHIKHRFCDTDSKGTRTCNFVCHTFWASQFEALRRAHFGHVPELPEDANIVEDGFLRSLCSTNKWDAKGGKSGATFSKTSDSRFVIKYVTKTEMEMFLSSALHYFEYLAKAFFHQLPTVLCKIMGAYQIGYHNKLTGKRYMNQVVVMQNLFYGRNIARVFDLKGSTRSRYIAVEPPTNLGEVENLEKEYISSTKESTQSLDGGNVPPVRKQDAPRATQVLLDENLMEFTKGEPLPLHDRSKAIFQTAIMNDTLYLSMINVVDYSIVVGIDEEHRELVVGIIDYMRQYDIIKRVERMGKSVSMVVGQAEPTIVQPSLYKTRFQQAMEKYFMTVPDKWTYLISFKANPHDDDNRKEA